jgi:hypothetical protein
VGKTSRCSGADQREKSAAKRAESERRYGMVGLPTETPRARRVERAMASGPATLSLASYDRSVLGESPGFQSRCRMYSAVGGGPQMSVGSEPQTFGTCG